MCHRASAFDPSRPYAWRMVQPIREATRADAVAIAAFFTSVYESVQGRASASAVEMLDRTMAVLFPADDATWVVVYDDEGVISGAAGISLPEPGRDCELLSIQAHDNVKGRGVAQTLLHRVIEKAREAGAGAIVTSVTTGDDRARGFLSREGFSPVEPTDEAAMLRYRKALAGA